MSYSNCANISSELKHFTLDRRNSRKTREGNENNSQSAVSKENYKTHKPLPKAVKTVINVWVKGDFLVELPTEIARVLHGHRFHKSLSNP